ncbi:unnamed protein product [Musa acuminata subsp. malaccensis]|uniref:(wild Malaysian banana) hypothetical protein n=1 Tax=Musa acuminata subsp. malaccensis TaxID=214687 RepID=A0A804I291_MUSAM|nr:unnamed protein product [Musa acuminata subsp. malaccensis]
MMKKREMYRKKRMKSSSEEVIHRGSNGGKGSFSPFF